MKKHAAFKWKDAISGFAVSPGSAEALVRWGGKIKYILISCFLGNICTKNCRNRTVYVKITASCTGGTFFETQCTMTVTLCRITIIRLAETIILGTDQYHSHTVQDNHITIIRLWLWVGDHYTGGGSVDGSMSQGWDGPEAVSQGTAVMAMNV